MIGAPKLRFARQVSGRWSLWGLRFLARFRRQPFARRMAMQFQGRFAQRSLLSQKHMVRLIVQVEPRIFFTYGSSAVAFSVANVQQIIKQEMRNPLRARLAIAPSRLELVVQRAAHLVSHVESKESVIRSIHGGRREVASLVERKVLESRRTAQFTTHHLSGRMERSTPFTSSAVALTLRRSAGVGEHAVSKAIAQRVHELERIRQAPEPPTRHASPNINVDHLVDQVIKQIDRRVVARRERLGKI